MLGNLFGAPIIAASAVRGNYLRGAALVPNPLLLREETNYRDALSSAKSGKPE
jgi:hypothetical protein